MAKKSYKTGSTQQGWLTTGNRVLTESKRFNKIAQKVNSITDVKELKKMIYNRNYRIRAGLKPKTEENKFLKFPPILDLRIVTASTFKRLNKITDKDELVNELRKVILSTTRRKNKPKGAGDYSGREFDYMQNGVYAIQAAVESWPNVPMKDKIHDALQAITVDDIQRIFGEVPSYWAISQGYYYAVANFDSFNDELISLIERQGIKLTNTEKKWFRDQLWDNDPKNYNTD